MSDKKTEAQKPLNVVQRTDRLEQGFNMLVGEVNNSLSVVDRKLMEQGELIAALVDLVGKDAVAERLEARQAERDAKAQEQAAAAVKLLVEQGKLKTVDTITESALIVGRDLDKDGAAVGPGRVQIAFRDLKPEFKEKFLGAKVGDKVPTVVTEEVVTQTFEVTEIYEAVQADATVGLAAPVSESSTQGT